MSSKLKLRIVEIFLVVGAALATSALFYSAWFQSIGHNRTIEMVIGLLTIPAVIVAYLIGGVHSAGQGAYTVGLVTQFVAIWSIVRYVQWSRARRKLANGAP